jgi:type IV pilus assembly protein PilX
MGRSQSGAVLVVTLILLLVLTVLGMTALRTSFLEERMARHTMDRAIALEAAEAALRDAERWLDGLVNLPHEQECADAASGNCLDVDVLDDAELLSFGGAAADDFATAISGLTLAQWQQHGRFIDADANDIADIPPGSGEAPRYLIREVRFIPDSLNRGHGRPPGRYLYEVSAIGFGATTATQVVLQSTFIRRY